MSGLVLREGIRYRSRDGQEFGPMHFTGIGPYPWTAPQTPFTWTSEGNFLLRGDYEPLDLVAEIED